MQQNPINAVTISYLNTLILLILCFTKLFPKLFTIAYELRGREGNLKYLYNKIKSILFSRYLYTLEFYFFFLSILGSQKECNVGGGGFLVVHSSYMLILQQRNTSALQNFIIL